MSADRLAHSGACAADIETPIAHRAGDVNGGDARRTDRAAGRLRSDLRRTPPAFTAEGASTRR